MTHSGVTVWSLENVENIGGLMAGVQFIIRAGFKILCLEYLYPKMSKGGHVVIDDSTLDGCRK